ncbi:fumarylacetoacetate hydrolase family protein [Roseovarius sp. BRH_c41]|jgi:2,4-diketo-3-deoxy-L-fuconate hydrolase|uniref:fumarylacetoacetate hydrolase family protein n=1 Tax=Roseovarius sp. BRH_c41 TaxID=1629709 RepID=UPI0005F21E36|nr:fumarylacetoacetate hydrolase family protein [Roseovarius sp. BRH_c41]KJS40986.1 MAG: 2-hydroxyhepta-2,4-diene-1,7-dioate isomerase [Roseovarius sp. BRH_c41]KJS44451.1 MAG: 2-hydroxyhepta-2,4-diene-1,7-dioate isomerase [Roseovarius sp. BRH_c41]
MKFARYGTAGQEKPAVLDDQGRLRDLSGVLPDLAGPLLADLPRIDPESLPLVKGTPRIGPPVGQVGKLICIGLNYTDHAEELGVDAPPEPVVFLKATSAITGPYDPVSLPRGARKGDWEIELGVVIGRRAKYVTEADALSHVAGYTIVNDVSERAYQMERAGQWTKGKSCDSFAPIGPWLVTPDEVDDLEALDLSLDLNGTRMQTGSTARMIFPVAHIVAYLSELMTLEPGDVIATGTPPGVGMGQRPPRYLAEGDEMVLRISGLGEQRSPVVRDR